MKITQMTSPRTGKAVANQFIVSTPEYRIFQSYDSIIVKKTGQAVELDETCWNYSKTTSKYRCEFLGETTKETREKIDNGTYKLANLN